MDRELYRLLTLPAATYNSIGGETMVLHLVQQRTQALREMLLRNTEGGWHVLSRRCDICRQYSPSAQELITHRHKHTVDTHFTCLICYKQFTSVKCIKIHYDKLRSDSECAAPFYKRFNSRCKSNSKRFVQSIDPIICGICHKQCTSYNYKAHIRIHSGQKSVERKICHKKLTRKSNLTVHMRIHTEDKPYECNICYKGYSFNNALRVHTRLHTTERPYTCLICSKRFNVKYHFTAHMRTHTGDKPYECSICHKRYSSNNALKVHTRLHSAQKP